MDVSGLGGLTNGEYAFKTYDFGAAQIRLIKPERLRIRTA